MSQEPFEPCTYPCEAWGECVCYEHKMAQQQPTVTMLPRDQVAHRFAVRKARDLIAQEDEQQIGDASDGCGEGPGGETE